MISIKLDEYGIKPTRAHATDAGLDLYSPIDIKLGYGMRRTIRTGVHVVLPKGTVGFVNRNPG